MKIFKKYKKWLFRFFVVVSSLVLLLCPFSVSAITNNYGDFTIDTYEISPSELAFKTINSNGSQVSVYSSSDLVVYYDNLLEFYPSAHWRDNVIMGVNGLGSWDLNYGHSLLMTKFKFTQCDLLDGRQYEISIPFFIFSDLDTDINLSQYGGSLAYGSNNKKMDIKTVQMQKETFYSTADDGNRYVYKGYYGKLTGVFTYDNTQPFNSLRTTIYFNSASGVFRWFGVYNSISITEVDPATVAQYKPPDDSFLDDYLNTESDVLDSTKTFKESVLSFFDNSSLSIFGNVTFLSSIKAVNNMLLYIWSSSWLGRLVSFSLLIGAFCFIIGTVAAVGRFGRSRE